MYKLLMIGLLILLGTTVQAQTAKVEELSLPEVKQAKALYAEQKDIEKRIADFRETIAKKYTEFSLVVGEDSTRTFCPTTVCTNVNIKPGWEAGFQFSEDYRFIVPATPVENFNPYNNCFGAMSNYGVYVDKSTPAIQANKPLDKSKD